MPSIASHFVCANLVSQNLGIKNDNFFFGNILPDIIDKDNSHYKKRNQYYLIPDIADFLKENNICHYLWLGYLCHLLLDKHFLEEYVPNYIKDYNTINVFTVDKIYKDYTTMNPMLLEMFDLNLLYLNKVMQMDYDRINQKKYLSNLNSINSINSDGKLNYIDFKSYVDFLKRISKIITQELKEATNNKNIIKVKV